MNECSPCKKKKKISFYSSHKISLPPNSPQFGMLSILRYRKEHFPRFIHQSNFLTRKEDNSLYLLFFPVASLGLGRENYPACLLKQNTQAERILTSFPEFCVHYIFSKSCNYSMHIYSFNFRAIRTPTLSHLIFQGSLICKTH